VGVGIYRAATAVTAVSHCFACLWRVGIHVRVNLKLNMI
jgi:hypothetical protein